MYIYEPHKYSKICHFYITVLNHVSSICHFILVCLDVLF
jgi:hypothetical protein